MPITFETAVTRPRRADVIGIPVHSDGPVPRGSLSRRQLELAAGLFLKEFVGDVPWAHIDMAGPMKSDRDDGWRSKGATAFGVRTLVELLDRYTPPR